jgi:hypothetical protein
MHHQMQMSDQLRRVVQAVFVLLRSVQVRQLGKPLYVLLLYVREFQAVRVLFEEMYVL